MTEPQEPGLRGRDIVCVGFADWRGGFWTNQQHLMSRLAVDNRVLFVESLGFAGPRSQPATLAASSGGSAAPSREHGSSTTSTCSPHSCFRSTEIVRCGRSTAGC